MKKMNKIFAVSFIAMMAVSAAHATVVTQSNIVGTGGVTVSVPASGETNAGKVVIKGTTYSGMTDAEVTAGTGTSNRLITPARLKAAIETWAPETDISGKQDKLNSGSGGNISITSNNASASGVVKTITASDGSVSVVRGTIASGDIANSAVGTNQIAGSAVTAAKLASDAVETAKIKDANVTKAKLESSVQASLDKADSALQAADIAGKQDIQIGAAKVSGADSTDKGKAVVVDADGKIAMSDNALGSLAYKSAVASADITNGTIVADDLASNAVTTAKIKNANVTTAKIADANVTTAKIADANVTAPKIADNVVKSGTSNVTVTRDSDSNFVVSVTDTDISGKQDKLGGSGNDGKAVIATSTAGTVNYRAIDTTSGGTANSTSLITSGAVNSGLSGKQNKIAAGTAGNVVTYSGTAGAVNSLGFDTAPTASSNNLVKSGAIKTALDAKEDVGNKVTSTAYVEATHDNETYYPTIKLTNKLVNDAVEDVAEEITGLDEVKQDKSTAVTHTASTAAGSASIPVYVASTGVATAISTFGSVASGNAALLKGGTVYTEVRPAQTSNGTGYLGAPASTSAATNLTNLDTALKTIHPKTGEVKIPSGSETSSTFASIWVE